MIPLTRYFGKGKAIRVKNISVFARDWEKRVTDCVWEEFK